MCTSSLIVYLSLFLSSSKPGAPSAPSAPAAVKSQAVDWSSFSALEALRAEEEDGNLADFSVFGDSNLKHISTEVSTTPADRLSVSSLSYYRWPFIALQSLT